jgi:outer membrane protein TolC
MEMLETELQIAAETANVRVARNDLLPLVNATYDYSINGLGPSLSDSLEMTSNKDFEDHRLGVRMEIPIGNQAARSRLRSALLSRMQQLGTKASRAAQIELEVRDAIDQLEANFQRILAAQKRVVLAARVLDLEIRQFNLGLRTTDDVLEAQASLGAAQLSEISALTEYQIAQIDIAFATGTLLGASQVAWEPGR